MAARAGRRPRRVVTLPMTPGTLLIFEGRHSLHRVSPIEGATLAPCRAPRLRHQAGHRGQRPAPRGPLRAHRALPTARRPDDLAGTAASSTQFGEAFVGSGAEAAHVNTVLGARGGPVETAWATALATPRGAMSPSSRPCGPASPSSPHALREQGDHRRRAPRRLTWGAAQAGVARGARGRGRRHRRPGRRRRRCSSSPRCGSNPEAADERAVFENNRAATLEALRAGRAGRPTVAEALSARAAVQRVLRALSTTVVPCRAIRLDQLNLVVADVEASRAFYARLGLDFGTRTTRSGRSTTSRPATATTRRSTSISTARPSPTKWNQGWPGGTGVVLGFKVAAARRSTISWRHWPPTACRCSSSPTTPSGAPATPS